MTLVCLPSSTNKYASCIFCASSSMLNVSLLIHLPVVRAIELKAMYLDAEKCRAGGCFCYRGVLS